LAVWCPGSEPSGLQGEVDAHLRIGRDVGLRAGCELAAVGTPRLRARVAPLDEGEDGDAGDDRQGEKGSRR